MRTIVFSAVGSKEEICSQLISNIPGAHIALDLLLEVHIALDLLLGAHIVLDLLKTNYQLRNRLLRVWHDMLRGTGQELEQT